MVQNLRKATADIEKQSAKVAELREKLTQLESGELKIGNTKKLESDLNGILEKIKELEAEADKLAAEKSSILSRELVPDDKLSKNDLMEQSMSGMVSRVDGSYFSNEDADRLREIKSKLSEIGKEIDSNNIKAEQMHTSLKGAVGGDTQGEIEKTKTRLKDAEIRLDSLRVKAEEAEEKIRKSANETSEHFSKVGDSFEKAGRRLISLAKSALVFRVITKGFTALRENTVSALMANEQFRQSVYQLQAALWVVSEPIYHALLPALQLLITGLTKGILYVAAFFSALGGKTLKQTIASAKALQKQAQAYGNIGKSSSKATKGTKSQTKAEKELKKATQEVNKELADFDELFILRQKTIDEISTPSDINAPSTIGGTGGIQSGFGELESLLNDGDMENLTKFQNWVLENKDAIKAALEIAGLGLLGLGIAGVAKKIGELLGLFKKKDSALDRQTDKTRTEAEAVNEMAGAFSYALSPAYSLSGALGTAAAAALGFIPQLDGVTASALGLTPRLNGATSSAYGLSPAFEAAASSAIEFVPAINSANAATKAIENQVTATMPVIEKEIGSAFGNVGQNISEFSSNTEANISTWSNSVETNFFKTAESAATSVHNALKNADDNFVSFFNHSAASVVLWGAAFAAANAKTAQKFLDDWGTSLKTAWDNFVSFAKATGKKISSTWGKQTVTISTALLLSGITVAKAALKPFSGRMNAAVPGLARGAVIPPNREFLAVLGDNKRENEIVSPVSAMKQAFREAIAEMGGIGGQRGDIVLQINGREFARATMDDFDRETRRRGTKLVKTT